jgi:hypothetical protein
MGHMPRSSRSSRTTIPTAAIAACALLLACGSDPEPDAPDEALGLPNTKACAVGDYEPTFAWISATVLEPRCANNSACHRGQTDLEALNLEPDAAYEALTAGMATTRDLALVEPGMPSESYLMIKLGAYDQTLRAGETMPFGTLLCREQLRAIDEWIAAGAEP